jgi:hypothetical protein
MWEGMNRSGEDTKEGSRGDMERREKGKTDRKKERMNELSGYNRKNGVFWDVTPCDL